MTNMQKTSVCKVCKKSLVGSDYLLCPECLLAFTIVLEVLREPKPIIESCLKMHPELTPDDPNRASEVFKWRNSRLGLAHLTPKVAGGQLTRER
jgi:hypothetical protein